MEKCPCCERELVKFYNFPTILVKGLVKAELNKTMTIGSRFTEEVTLWETNEGKERLMGTVNQCLGNLEKLVGKEVSSTEIFRAFSGFREEEGYCNGYVNSGKQQFFLTDKPLDETNMNRTISVCLEHAKWIHKHLYFNHVPVAYIAYEGRLRKV